MIVESQNGNLSSLDLVNVGMDLTKKVSVKAAEVYINKLFKYIYDISFGVYKIFYCSS